MEKLVLKAEDRKPIVFETIRIYPETAKIINDLADATGITKVKLIHKLISFAAENSVIEDTQEG